MTDLQSKCPGVHLIERGYEVVNKNVEYPAIDLKGQASIVPFQNFRYYFCRDAEWPVPGEFIGMLAKPFPTHVWWFQESSPLLYSGNWVETNHYTSGIVTEKLPQQEGKYGFLYRVVVRGVTLVLTASDFLEYEVGDRVAIIRLPDLGRFTDKTKGNFKWFEMEDLFFKQRVQKKTPLPDTEYIVEQTMMIVPITFYKKKEA